MRSQISKIAVGVGIAAFIAAFLVFVYPTRYFYWNDAAGPLHRRMRQDRFTGRVSILAHFENCENGSGLMWSDQCEPSDPFAAYGGHLISGPSTTPPTAPDALLTAICGEGGAPAYAAEHPHPTDADQAALDEITKACPK